MVRPHALSAERVAAALTGLPEWSGDVTGIHRRIREASLLAAAERAVELATIAAEMDHHPDLDIRHRTLTVFLVTHSADGVTELDLEFARRVDELLSEGNLENPSPAERKALDQIDQACARGRQRKFDQPGRGA
ncbi:4a-hydroxytetrahydrobiopterin dehydratase [Modestobacter sp. DSM 44400]|uniref:4a-hydroxytetrahydrobiopterin dehydratase n=1 Tax=Modestobacter sp. DSM 44400 TaxID=1550230 RepID=UPI0008941E44|nr:4a-hydroxytetrahydrobiopterin dehydratase [Modestobacter sp. DSM 44400]SDX79842.1 4a-hydroxytetrahydrobiopterin dehydratase [Modestobacter sp. DSM 44400]